MYISLPGGVRSKALKADAMVNPSRIELVFCRVVLGYFISALLWLLLLSHHSQNSIYMYLSSNHISSYIHTGLFGTYSVKMLPIVPLLYTLVVHMSTTFLDKLSF